uniref:Uncharacterized protein n=1 Tax=Arundo donax TaxID=35708 RepID=A0A0A8Z306_ARUDO
MVLQLPSRGFGFGW